jgi:hypothetical protein
MFKIKKHLLLLLIGILAPFYCFSQDDSGSYKPGHNPDLVPLPPPGSEIFYRGSVQGGGGLVIPFSNKALRLSLVGQYYLHFSANYVLVPHIYAGIEIENSELIPSAIAPYNTQMFIYNAGLKFGYYTFMQHDFLFSYSLSLGPTLVVYLQNHPTPSPKGGYKQQTYFATPSMLASYRVNDELRVGIEFSYIILSYRYNPAYTGISQLIPDYNPSYANAPMSYFELGFGIYYAFAEGRK